MPGCAGTWTSWRSPRRARSTEAPAPCMFCCGSRPDPMMNLDSAMRVLGAAAVLACAGMAAAQADPGAAAAAGFDLVTDGEMTQWNAPRAQAPSEFATRDSGDEAGGPTCRS